MKESTRQEGDLINKKWKQEIDEGTIVVQAALNNPDETGSVKVPITTLEAAKGLITNFWSDTEPEESSRINMLYGKLGSGPNFDEERTQFTLNETRTEVAKNRFGKSKGEFPFYAIIKGNQVPLSDKAMSWLKQENLLTEAE